MTALAKIEQLRLEIKKRLLPLITADSWLLELPNHSNVGDTLILEGELNLLRESHYRCKHMCSIGTFRYPRIPKDDLILINGGGSFGDTWPESMAFKMSIVDHYHDNKILFFPQSAQFTDDKSLSRTIKKLKCHGNVTVCVRDQHSFDLLVKAGHDKTYLVPDIAFYMDVNSYQRNGERLHELLIPRDDRESKSSNILKQILLRPGIVVQDWPPLHKTCIRSWCFKMLTLASRFVGPVPDWYMLSIYKSFLVKEGVSLIQNASTVYSTRLHGGILAMLLGKKVVLIDNAYGKCSRFFDTWLYDCNDVSIER